MRICLVLEGCYPYVHGGVSTWMHGYIQAMPEHEFVLWVIGAHAADRGKFVYELPGQRCRGARGVLGRRAASFGRAGRGRL